MERKLTYQDFESLAEFRRLIRRFLHFSEQAARNAGLEPKQHQLLLALKGLPGCTVGVEADAGLLAAIEWRQLVPVDAEEWWRGRQASIVSI